MMDEIPSQRCDLCRTDDLAIPDYQEHLRSEEHSLKVRSVLRQTINAVLSNYGIDALETIGNRLPVEHSASECVWCRVRFNEADDPVTITLADLSAKPFLEMFGRTEAQVHRICNEAFLEQFINPPEPDEPPYFPVPFNLPPATETTRRIRLTDGTDLAEVSAEETDVFFRSGVVNTGQLAVTLYGADPETNRDIIATVTDTMNESGGGILTRLKRRLLIWLFS